MFKKTLLALAVAGASVATAQAATVYVNVADGAAVTAADFTVTPAAGEALGVGGVIGGADDNCDVAATDLNLTLGGTTASAGGNDDTLTAANGAGKFVSAASIAMTAADACTATAASVITKTPLKHGIEYSSVTEVEITPSIVAGLGGYKDEDTFTINLTGAKIDLDATTAPKITIAGLGGVTNGSAGGLTDFTFSVLDISESQVRFTLQTADAQADFINGGAILNVSGIFLDSTGLTTATSVAVSTFATNTSGTDFDASSAAVVATLTPQYSAEVTTAFDAKIDVAKDRQQFAGLQTSDSIVYAVTKNTTGDELTPAEATYVFTGDFSWMNDFDANEDGKFSSAEIGNAASFNAGAGNDVLKSWALNSDLDELTLVTTVTGDVDTSGTVTLTVKGYDEGALENAVIPVQDFTFAASVQDDKSFSTAAVDMPATTAIDAGEWTLNGSVVVVPYLPFGPNTQPIIRHTNAGTRSGDISVRYMVEGEHTEWQSLGVLVEDSEPGVRNLLSQVTDALKGEGYDAAEAGFKVTLEVVTNVPAKDVWVYAAAKVTTTDSDRLTVGAFKNNRNAE